MLTENSLTAGPDIAWYNQFRHSCDGFETRIRMDCKARHLPNFTMALLTTISGQTVDQDGSKGEIRPAQDFNFVSLDVPNRNQTFHLAAHFEPKLASSEPFQFYYRFGGLTNDGRNLAVDVDAGRQQWRLSLLSGPDSANKWLAQQSHTLGYPRSQLPQFSRLIQDVIRNGTFGYSDRDPQYIHIPELDFVIGNMVDFLSRCEYEPSIRVYNAHGLDGAGRRALGDLPWSSHSGDRVVIRGASFGHGRKRLDMCLREGPIQPQTLERTDEGAVADELLVPFAIISALRHQVWESRRRRFEC